MTVVVSVGTVACSTMILNSLIANGEKTIGDSLTTNEQTHYLGKLNAMLESWSLNPNTIFTMGQDSLPLTAGTVSYTIGSGGTFNTNRPVKIVNAFVRDGQDYDHQLEIVGENEYNQIRLKSSGNTYPDWLYYDAGYVSGLATIYVYPAPVASLTLYISSYQQLQAFASVSTTLAMPPGYQRAIESNFAIECSPGLKSVPPELAKIARDSLAAVKSVNLPDVVSRLDVGIVRGGRTNIITGP